jgi:hypothetical protein
LKNKSLDKPSSAVNLAIVNLAIGERLSISDFADRRPTQFSLAQIETGWVSQLAKIALNRTKNWGKEGNRQQAIGNRWGILSQIRV